MDCFAKAGTRTDTEFRLGALKVTSLITELGMGTRLIRSLIRKRICNFTETYATPESLQPFTTKSGGNAKAD
jgi:hypothetical protein